jgi:hypothetical protein
MVDLRNLEAEERALVTFARHSICVYAITHSERTYLIARDALVLAESLRREVQRLRHEALDAAKPDIATASRWDQSIP